MFRRFQPETIASVVSGLDLPFLKAVYGFGSYESGQGEALGVDILLVFADDALADMPEAIRAANALAVRLAPEFGEGPHLTRLTERECAKTGFIERVGARLIWERSA
ncbi:MAG: hypothetical protein ACRD1G_20590 [Acidimicrobiales bacterium]